MDLKEIIQIVSIIIVPIIGGQFAIIWFVLKAYLKATEKEFIKLNGSVDNMGKELHNLKLLISGDYILKHEVKEVKEHQDRKIDKLFGFKDIMSTEIASIKTKLGM